MKAKSFFALVAAALTLAACAPKAPVVDPVFEVTGAAIKGNKIVAAAEGATAKFTVNSNLSWEAKSNAEWLSITPASAEGDKVNAKKVTVEVVVAANTATESRNTTIELNAPGYEPLTVTLAVEQEGLVPVLNVYEADMDPIANEEIVECDATEFILNIESNVAFTTTSSEAWADVTELQDPQNTSAFLSGSIKFEANEGEARSTVITITPAGGLQPVSFTLTQEAADQGPIGVLYEALFGYSGKYYYWSKGCYFQYDPKGTWNDGDSDFNAQLVDFASAWEDEQFKLNGYIIPCFWDDTEMVMNVGTYYSFASYTASAEDAENWSSSGVKEGDVLDVFLYAKEYYVPFDYVQYNDGTHGLAEQTAGMLQAVLATETSLIAYFPAKVSLTAFQEAAVAQNSPKFSVAKGSLKPVAFEKPISLNGRTIKHVVR